MTAPESSAYILDAIPALDAFMRDLESRRAVFFAGLPGTGKSLFVHQLAHLASAAGRGVHLLQWDVSRQGFETAETAARYPVVNGVTHIVVRRAVGLWARDRVLEWSQAHSNDEAILIGEVPLIGNRLIELVTPADDNAEAFLASPECVFALPVPSNDVRRHIEAQRVQRHETPQHERERQDASPNVMRMIWQQLLTQSFDLGLLDAAPAPDAPFDAGIYRRLYEHLLRARHSVVIPIDSVLPTDAMSVYDHPPGIELILPDPGEVAGWIERAEGDLAT